MDGQSSYTEFVNGSTAGATLNFRYLGIRLITNSTDVNFRASDWIGFYAGWHYADRQIRTIEGLNLLAFQNASTSNFYEVGNQMQSGDVGVRIHPWKPLTINLEGELGRTNNPLATLSDKNFQTINGRVQYRVKNLQMSASYKESYDFNSSFSLYSSHVRGYTASAVWTPRSWFSLDASYNKLHNDSDTLLAFFAGAPGFRDTHCRLTIRYTSVTSIPPIWACASAFSNWPISMWDTASRRMWATAARRQHR